MWYFLIIITPYFTSLHSILYWVLAIACLLYGFYMGFTLFGNLRYHTMGLIMTASLNKTLVQYCLETRILTATHLCQILIATIHGRAKYSYLTWSGITIGKLPPHHHHHIYVPQLYRVIQYKIATIQDWAELSNLEWYYYQKIAATPHHQHMYPSTI